MRRRHFIAGVGTIGIGIWPGLVRAQQPVPLIGVLSTLSPADERLLKAFRERLAELNFREKRDYVLEVRWASGQSDRLPALASELMALKPAILVASNTSAALALKRVSGSTPIVAALLTDPIGLGLASSFARPGGTVTGTLLTLDSLSGKSLDLAREIVPGASRIGFLVTDDAPARVRVRDAEAAAAALGVQLIPARVQTSDQLDAAFKKLSSERAEIVLVLPATLFTSERRRVASAALAAKLPIISWYREQTQDGGLLSYGSDLRDNYRRSASYAVRILQGTAPGELPIEFPTKFELVINLKTAKALGLTIPEAFLLRADEVIE